MRKLTLTLFLSAAITGLNAQIGTWTAKASLSFSRATQVGFALQGKGYICGGATASSNLKDLWQYDPATNSWSQKADMPGDPRQELTSFVIGNYAYVGHGRNVATSEIFYSFNRYDPSTNTWSAIADCPVKRITSTGFEIDGTGYVTCGYDGIDRFKDLYAYNPTTNVWTKKASLPVDAIERSFASVAAVDHKAYLMGGFGSQIVKDFYEYDPSTDTWTSKGNYPGGNRYTAAAMAIGRYVFIGLGKDAFSTDHKDWYIYDPQKEGWEQINDYPTDNVGGHSTFVISNKGYVCAGTNKAGNIRDYLYELSIPMLGIKETAERAGTYLKPYMASNTNVLYCNALRGKFEVNVYDISGKLVYNQSQFSLEDTKYAFELLNLSKGIYVAYFINEGLSKALKIRVD